MPIARLRSAALAALTVVSLAASLVPSAARADDLGDLEAQVAREQAQLARIQAQSLSIQTQQAEVQSRINRLQAMLVDINNRLLATNARLSADQDRLNQLQAQEDRVSARLVETQKHLESRETAFGSQVRVLDKIQGRTPMSFLMTSHSFSDLLGRLSSLKQVADGTRTVAVQLKADRDRIAADRTELEGERAAQAATVAAIDRQRRSLEQEYGVQAAASASLARLTAQLGQQQQQLTTEATVLSGQIASAEDQITSLLAFSSGQGGVQVVAPEYLSNGWGTYFNQRDARWGNGHVGQSPYTVAAIGCLLTSVAMVNSHFGQAFVTPGTIAADRRNFTPDGLLYNFVLDVPGHPATINHSPTRAWINGYLQRGGTVIVGMNIRSGGTHFVVLVGQNGSSDYWINDPWVEDAMHVSYNASPVTGTIYSAIGYV